MQIQESVPLGQSGGVDRRAVAEEGGAGSGAVAEIGECAGAVGLAHAQVLTRHLLKVDIDFSVRYSC